MKQKLLMYLIFFLVCQKGVTQTNEITSAPLQFRVPVETYVRSYVEPRLQTWLKWARYEESMQ